MAESTYSWHSDAWRHAHAALNRGAHALLVSGARGLGKRALALQLAASRLCAAREDLQYACGHCESCRWLAAGTHPDFTLIEPIVAEAGEGDTGGAGPSRGRPITIDQIRAAADRLTLTGHRDAGKVVVIYPAEALNGAAANALLKNLEEPPSGTIFILVAHRAGLLPPTVRSRCQVVRVRLGERAPAESWLRSQGVSDPEQALALFGGAPLEALEAQAQPGMERRSQLLTDLGADDADSIALADKYRDIAPSVLLSWIQKWTFDLVLMQVCGRVRYHQDLNAEIARCAQAVDPVAATRLHRRFLAMQRHIHHPLNPRLLVEQMLMDCHRLLKPGQGALT